MYFGRKASLDLNRHRTSLAKTHASLQIELAKHSGHPFPASLTERIELLRLAYRTAIISSLTVIRTINSHSDVLNIASAMQALVAQQRLDQVCQIVMKTLDDIDKSRSATKAQ